MDFPLFGVREPALPVVVAPPLFVSADPARSVRARFPRPSVSSVSVFTCVVVEFARGQSVWTPRVWTPRARAGTPVETENLKFHPSRIRTSALALARDLASRPGERETSSAEPFVSPFDRADARRLERRDGESIIPSTDWRIRVVARAASMRARDDARIGGEAKRANVRRVAGASASETTRARLCGGDGRVGGSPVVGRLKWCMVIV